MEWKRPRTIVSVAAVAVVAAVAGVTIVAGGVAVVGPIVVPVTVTGAAGLVPTSYIAHRLIQCLALLVEPCSIHYAALARHRTALAMCATVPNPSRQGYSLCDFHLRTAEL